MMTRCFLLVGYFIQPKLVEINIFDSVFLHSSLLVASYT